MTTDHSEIEALAKRVEALATDFTSVDESDKRDAIASDLRELARRLQPARVPMANLTRDVKSEERKCAIVRAALQEPRHD